MPARKATRSRRALQRPHEPRSVLPIKSRLAERCRDLFRTNILEGHWRNILPSEKQLSEEFQVSRPTLRLALHSLHKEGLLLIRRGQPTRILGRTTRRGTPGLRRPEVVLLRDARSNPDSTSLLLLTDPLRRELHRLAHGLTILDALASGKSRFHRAFVNIETQYNPSYFILFSIPAEAQRWFQQRRTPAIILGSRPPDVRLPAIEIDPEATMLHAVDFMVRNGHRRLALITIPPQSVGAHISCDTFERACLSHRSIGVTGVVKTCIERPGRVERAVRELFLGKHAPTGVIVVDLELLVGLYGTLGELGLRIPKDVSVLSLGSWPVADYLRPPPDCYCFSWENLAKRIVRIISDHLRLGVWPNRFWKLLPTLREGQSVSNPGTSTIAH